MHVTCIVRSIALVPTVAVIGASNDRRKYGTPHIAAPPSRCDRPHPRRSGQVSFAAGGNMNRLSVRCAPAAALMLGCLIATNALAQETTSTPPRTQDQVLRQLLALGDADGCIALLNLPAGSSQQDVANTLAALGPQIGNELRAICGPSAVASASSLGGGIQSLQAIKTVTQFRVARGRIDQRLKPPPKPAPKPPKLMAPWLAPAQPAADMPRLGPASVFAEVDFATRDRTDTPYESGYDSDVRGVLFGADVTNGRVVAGGWFGITRQEGDFTRFGALFDDRATDSFADVLGDPDVLASVCGGLSDAGTFEQRATRFGGFVGWRAGSAGFMDVAAGWTRREHDYARSACAIEAQGTLTFTNGELRGDGILVDDIYAGVLSGESTIHEIGFSFRAGADAGNEHVTVSPRAVLTYTRATADAYTETGRSTVANDVVPNEGLTVERVLGGPIGFELAFDEQIRTSLLLEAGGEVAVHAGNVSPFFFGYWRQEFMDEFPLVTARFAQDLRDTPTLLEFGYDAWDPRAFRFGFGVNAFGGDRVAARLELSRLVADTLFSGQVVSIQARVRF
jgi:hypothetical protein